MIPLITILLFLASAPAFGIVKYAGAGYLVYLGIKSNLSRNSLPVAGNSAQPTLAQMFRRRLVVNLLNPKSALFFYAFLPHFVDRSRKSPTAPMPCSRRVQQVARQNGNPFSEYRST